MPDFTAEQSNLRSDSGWCPPQVKEIVATAAGVAAVVGVAVTICGASLAPVQSRMDRIETKQSQDDRDGTEIIQRLTRVEERTGDNTRILRRVENWMERHR